MNLYEAQWLAYALPYRRFAAALTDCDARLGADMDRYSFIVSDLHRLLVAGLPAHCERFCTSSPARPNFEDDGAKDAACENPLAPSSTETANAEQSSRVQAHAAERAAAQPSTHPIDDACSTLVRFWIHLHFCCGATWVGLLAAG
jgi:hypothetical protein